MVTLKDKEAKQVNHILNTLIEATEHFSTLIKNKELNQSIFIFSSIVDGFSAIQNTLNKVNSKTGEKERTRIEQLILLIAQQLEQGKLLKVAEIIQFSLMPDLRKLKQVFENNNHLDRTTDITIGVYLCQKNPRDAYPENRINALVKESERQGVNILFFSSKDVDLDKKQITADQFKNGKWNKVTAPFPDVIHNIGVRGRTRQSVTERKLRRELPFTSFAVGNKLYLPKKLLEYRKFAHLLVPFKIVTDKNVVTDFFNDNTRTVLKPILGRQGQHIYFVEKTGNRYTLSEHTKKQILGQEKFEEWLDQVILKKKGSYIVQRYVHCRTKNNEPFDIRAHVQKDGQGKWQLTKIYPRIGSNDSILSNISRGGRTEELESLFEKEFGKKGQQYVDELTTLAMDVTIHLDKIYGQALDELGLDLAIDEEGRFWMHEVNNGPQSTFHEEERAINTIAYATYIAENGIYFTNEFQKWTPVKDQFDSRSSKLPISKLDDKCQIGMLVDKNEINDLTVACAYVAHYEDVHFYYFTPKDIDYNEMLIRGHFYENNEWVPKIVNYPDVVYDRLRLRGIKGYQIIYEELDGIPFTNEFFGNSISKLEVYDQLKATGELDDVIIPYQQVHRVSDIFKYLDKYSKVILKPEIGSFARGVHFIEKLDYNDYFMVEGEKETTHNHFSLTNYFNSLLKQGSFIVQKYIETRTIDGHPFDIRVHMMKDGNGKWSFVKRYPRIGYKPYIISSTIEGGYIGNLLGFLKRNFSNLNEKELEKTIDSLSMKIVETYDQIYDDSLGEIALDLALNKKGQPFLIEVNVNKPGIVYYEFDVAKHAIPYAKFLAMTYRNAD